ncbi:amino acid-binding protein [Ignicoccus pacificus DSM 13166]|uniref:Amino acid-binding protein n=1 Tax=Ignicoccus pacificus DSM 13166 TaxID=940294 RepID=A0A977KBS2_9CREN|nr:amino acid-binding protein [Ignicoccus pacificus DSM 13166]
MIPRDIKFLALVNDLSGMITIVSEEKVGECIGPYKALVSEEMDPSTVGFLAEVSRKLAKAGIPIMVYASFERDYVLVPSKLLEKALEVLAKGP